MTKKKSILSLILAIVMLIPAMFLFSACGQPIDEKGKTYTVKNVQKDIVFHWGDDKETLIKEVGSEENAKAVFGTWIIAFDDVDNVTISIAGGSDGELFYVINQYNCIEFYDTKADAENRVNRNTDDYFDAEYKFSADKRVITITHQVSDKAVSNKTSVVIKLTVNS